jgi:hypothetical protein
VVTDHVGYPRFNLAVAKVTVVATDEHGAAFVAARKTRVAKQVRAFDRYERHRGLVIKPTKEGDPASWRKGGGWARPPYLDPPQL